MKIKFIIQLLRPQQWAKNGFIFLPLFFNGQFTNITLLLMCTSVFFAFSFAASSVYCFNDIYDVNADRLHPEKCKRPIASGKLSKFEGYIAQIFCMALSFVILLLFGGESRFSVGGIILFYYLMNIAYCVKLKHFAIIDVAVIAVGFVLRVLSGGIAGSIFLSEWIILMTFLLALLLAFAKRRDDVAIYQSTGIQPRKNTNRYNMEFMNQVIAIISAIIIVAYIMYSVSPEVTARFNSNYVYLTSIFVLLGIIRYLQITTVDLKSSSPTKILMHDRFIQSCIALWVISFFIIIYQ
ncbi:MAG: UbiA prenyltransferase family protein [Dysgonamonadaceae bacterium]|jgi:4-hydroxybenzoate polyprenyltransferase|nr:UbiA prenyltransferase family protein [Dysgonamonadaceae bacterium]